MEKKYLISLSCSERFLRKTKMRVKPKAIYEFREFLENIANDFAHKIAIATQHRKKKTITKEDVEFVKNK